MAMMAMTTNSSINVNPVRVFELATGLALKTVVMVILVTSNGAADLFPADNHLVTLGGWRYAHKTCGLHSRNTPAATFAPAEIRFYVVVTSAGELFL